MDITVRFLAWLLRLCTPRPRGRHRLTAEPQGRFTPAPPPLRSLPAPPPRFTEILDGNASRLVRPYTPDPYLRTPHTPCSTPLQGTRVDHAGSREANNGGTGERGGNDA